MATPSNASASFPCSPCAGCRAGRGLRLARPPCIRTWRPRRYHEMRPAARLTARLPPSQYSVTSLQGKEVQQRCGGGPAACAASVCSSPWLLLPRGAPSAPPPPSHCKVWRQRGAQEGDCSKRRGAEVQVHFATAPGVPAGCGAAHPAHNAAPAARSVARPCLPMCGSLRALSSSTSRRKSSSRWYCASLAGCNHGTCVC